MSIENGTADWIDVMGNELETAPCPDCGEQPITQVAPGRGIYRVACDGCGNEGDGRTIPEATKYWNEVAEEGPQIAEPMPPDCPAEEKIYLRLALSENGGLYLYDAVTGRPVAHQSGMDVVVVDETDQIQTAVIEVYTDGRLVDEGARKAIMKRGAL